MRVLDLFSGAGGWSQAFRDAGDEVFTIDLDPRFQADAVLAALPWRPDYIFASPPCNSFSTMTMGRMWTQLRRLEHLLDMQLPASAEGPTYPRWVRQAVAV